jgi:hypothetical protein
MFGFWNTTMDVVQMPSLGNQKKPVPHPKQINKPNKIPQKNWHHEDKLKA